MGIIDLFQLFITSFGFGLYVTNIEYKYQFRIETYSATTKSAENRTEEIAHEILFPRTEMKDARNVRHPYIRCTFTISRRTNSSEIVARERKLLVHVRLHSPCLVHRGRRFAPDSNFHKKPAKVKLIHHELSKPSTKETRQPPNIIPEDVAVRCSRFSKHELCHN